ncbi:hypothetical protein J437_LFUL012514 [Ladona fulva]|uniref:Uncharacterized protein n=1 Tax=Ladona fulva TaxID=123851 RepID=A0A8K0K1U0_LADFU|nr:hypothetical protein J437_LFUL012514 [Ladona fulva]
MRTSLGWMLSGDAKTQPHVNLTSTVHHCEDEEDLNELLTRFWKQEDIRVSKKILSPNEQKCEELFFYLQKAYYRLLYRLIALEG